MARSATISHWTRGIAEPAPLRWVILLGKHRKIQGKSNQQKYGKQPKSLKKLIKSEKITEKHKPKHPEARLLKLITTLGPILAETISESNP